MLRDALPGASAIGREINDGVEDLFTGGNGHPSPIAISVMAAVTEIMASRLKHPDGEALAAGVMYGYWLRVFADRDMQTVPSFSLPADLPLTPSGGFDYERWQDDSAISPATSVELLDKLWEYSESDEPFSWLAPTVATVVLAWATDFIHTNGRMHGRVAKTMDIELTAACVRVGYAVRSFELRVGALT